MGMRTTALVLLLASTLLAQDKTESIVDAPLAWLARSQMKSGAWPADDGRTPDIGATSLALLAYLGAGETDSGSAPHRTNVRTGIRFLTRIDGRIGLSTREHAQATLALCEAFVLTRNPIYVRPARAAVSILASLQEKDGGFGDLETDGWAGLALKSAGTAGFEEGQKAREALLGRLSKAKDDGDRAVAVHTALRALLDGDAERVAKGIEALRANPPSAERRDPLYAYFGALATYQAGGDAWKTWSESIAKTILPTRKKDGSFAAEAGLGRVSSTACRSLALLIHHRFTKVAGVPQGDEPDEDIEVVEEDEEGMSDAPFSGPSTNSAIGLGGGAGGRMRGRGGRRNMRAYGGSSGNTESYDRIVSRGFANPWDQDASTFSVDVDTAAYANVRRFLKATGQMPPKDAVRIEEMLNYFPYGDAPPAADATHPFRVHWEVATCPWQPKNRLVRIALKAKEIELAERPASNLVFLLDVSGSMNSDNKLPLLKRALRLLVERLDARDTVSIVVYAGAAGLALPPTNGTDRAAILGALERLQAGGSTNGGEGLALAYAIAKKQFVERGVNRVLLCTDGDFNVGISDRGTLTRRIEEEAKAGVGISILGFGMGNYKDARLEELSNKGDGNYAYIDTISEARKVLVEQLTGTLVTVAKDAKIQVFFNPARVGAWRLIGYENRLLAKEDFNDDKKDAGEIGAGHAVTALYEIVPAAEEARKADDNPFFRRPELTEDAKDGALLRLRLRYKRPGSDASVLLEDDVKDEGRDYGDASEAFRWSSSVAMFGMLLRDDENKGLARYVLCEELARGAVGDDPHGYRKEMLELVARAKILAAVHQ